MTDNPDSTAEPEPLYQALWELAEDHEDPDEKKAYATRLLADYYEMSSEQMSSRRVEFSIALVQLLDEFDDLAPEQKGEELAHAQTLTWRQA